MLHLKQNTTNIKEPLTKYHKQAYVLLQCLQTKTGCAFGKHALITSKEKWAGV